MILIELGKTPVPGVSPSGSDIRGEEMFDTLSSEIEKMSSPSAAAAIDWQKILDICTDILQNHSKDILVASYLSIALIKTEGMKGLATGVRVYHDITTTYWETLFPVKTRMRGRRNAIEWWVEKMSSILTGLQPQTWQKSEIESLYNDLGDIESFLRENMDDAPVVAPLMSSIGSLLVEEKAKQEKVRTEEASKAQPAPPAGGETRAPAAAPEPPVSGDDPEPIIRHAVDSLRVASDILTRQDILDGLFFRINRAIAWMTVTDVPPNQGGTTMIEPPDGQIRESLASMYHSGSWKNLLMACESRIPQYLFWLDLSRYVVEALEQTGKNNVADEVAGATLVYAKRLPGIERFSFSDGTPFADSETRQWLETMSKKPQASEDAQSSDKDLIHQIEEEAAQAGTIARNGNLSEAIKMLRGKLGGSVSVRERFIRQIWLCRFLAYNNQRRLFEPYLQELIALIDTYRVEEWEPPLAVQAYSNILRMVRSAGPNEYKDIDNRILERLTLLDPLKAMDYI